MLFGLRVKGLGVWERSNAGGCGWGLNPGDLTGSELSRLTMLHHSHVVQVHRSPGSRCGGVSITAVTRWRARDGFMCTWVCASVGFGLTSHNLGRVRRAWIRMQVNSSATSPVDDCLPPNLRSWSLNRLIVCNCLQNRPLQHILLWKLLPFISQPLA